MNTIRDDSYDTDAMAYDILTESYDNKTPIYKRANNNEPVSFRWLTEEDRILLIDYAPKLFNTYKGDVKNVMLQLVEKVGLLRFEQFYNQQEKQRLKRFALNKKSKQEKINSLQNHISAILSIIGNEENPIIGLRTSIDDLIINLKKAYTNAELYLPYYFDENVVEVKGEEKLIKNDSKELVKIYLKGLNLKSKTPEINDFLKEL